MEMNPHDLDIDVYRAPLNDCAVPITHVRSGVSVYSEDQPTREQNYASAMQLLHDALDT